MIAPSQAPPEDRMPQRMGLPLGWGGSRQAGREGERGGPTSALWAMEWTADFEWAEGGACGDGGKERHWNDEDVGNTAA